MLPAYLYTPFYFHTMLLVVIGCALLYWAAHAEATSLHYFNKVAMCLLAVGLILFMGFRPISGVFIDMVGYARSYERVQQGAESNYNDGLFYGLMRMCGPFLPAEGFFFVCSLIYVAPLVLASWRVHGAWAFPVFLACLTAFSFWGYGVNGIRNGMATSVLILAFAFYDKPVVMFPLMGAAWGLHGSVLLPASAFVIVRYVKRTEIWLVFWVLCAIASLLAGNVGQLLLSRYNPFAWDDRIEGYILGAEDYGFRPGFLAYSIVPVLVALLMAAPTRTRARRLVRGLRNAPAMRWIADRSARTAKSMGMGRRGLTVLRGTSRVGSLALAGFGSFGGGTRSALGATLSTREQSRALGSQPVAERHDKTKGAWGRLPWVRMLRSDPFYARLINTYLLTNAVWVLLIQVRFSNRFAYLSWFMMPWVLLYPFVPGKVNGQPRTGLVAAILAVHYLFTYFMWVVVYRMRFG